MLKPHTYAGDPKYHVSLNWAFNHYFSHLSIFTVEDIMKIKPANFEMSIKISL